MQTTRLSNKIYECGICKAVREGNPCYKTDGLYVIKLCPECYEHHAEAQSKQLDEQGRKDDSGKPQMELLPMDALMEVSKVLTHGAKKYAPGNWKLVKNAGDRYTGALLRHLALWREGEKIDAESGGDHLLHIAQVATNALFLVWLELDKEEV